MFEIYFSFQVLGRTYSKFYFTILTFAETSDISMRDMTDKSMKNNTDETNGNSFLHFYLFFYIVVIVILIIALVVCIYIPQQSGNSYKVNQK